MTFHDCDGKEIPYDGSPLTWRVSAYAVVSRHDEILLIKSKIEKLYDIPGGGIEMDETIEQAIARECHEEAGIKVKLGSLIHAAEDYFYHRELKQFFKTIQLFYHAKIVGEISKPTDPRTEFVGFMNRKQFDQYPLPIAVQIAIQKTIRSTVK